MINLNNWGKLLVFGAFACLVMLIYSCNGENNAPDVSDINVELEIYRFDKDLYAIDTNNVTTSLNQLYQKYPDFLNFYLDTLMGFPIRQNYSDTNVAIIKGLLPFLTYKDYRGLYDTIAAHYPNTDNIDEQLKRGFKYLKYYFTDYEVPKVIYVSAGLSKIGAFTYGSDIIGVSLDMFLGVSYPYYKSVGVADYLEVKLREEYIPVAVFQAIYRDYHPFVAEQKTLLELMVQSGKEMYYTQKVLPFVEEHLILGYTKDELAWCKDNETMVYNFFVQQKLLYDNTLLKVIRYVMDGPSATGMPDESPGAIGSWIGLKIIEAYMDKHPEMTLKDLMTSDVSAQKILQESKYKPK